MKITKCVLSDITLELELMSTLMARQKTTLSFYMSMEIFFKHDLGRVLFFVDRD